MDSIATMLPQMKASRALNWTFSESQLIIIKGNVRAPFYLHSMLSQSPDGQVCLSPAHFTELTSRTDTLKE